MPTVSPDSLDWALTHAEQHGDTDVFPLPFEFAAIRHDWTRLRSELAREDLLQWQVRPHRRLLSPKARHGFRIVTQLDPLDFLLFSAAVYEIGSHLEASRSPTTEGVVFSFRYAPSVGGQLFDPGIGYGNFQRATRDALEKDPTIRQVVVADIADFYSRIYLHRLENALDATSAPRDHVRAIMRLLHGWNASESYGIPVGSAAARLLAEATIADVDAALIANGAKFIRFSDDYRLFAHDYTEAYRQLAFLADVLFRNQGLTLQGQKTTILTKDAFAERYLRSYEEHEVHTLRERFDEIISELGLGNPYEPIKYEDLPPEVREKVDQLNLATTFRDELRREAGVDVALIKFVLRRLGQLGDASVVEEALANIEDLYPEFPDVVLYLRSLPSLSASDKSRIGSRILDLLENSVVSSLEYHRMWALDLFTADTAWDNERRFMTLLASARDPASRRKLILAMGRAQQRHWFQSQWRDLFGEAPWPRRAMIAAASCLPPDARNHWYRAIRPRLDTLERAVVEWSAANPFTTLRGL